MAHILAFHAHPDDIEMLAAGTLALLSAKGHRITIATMTAGDCGSTTHSREETGAIRRREAEAAASLIGAACICAGTPDLGLFNDAAQRTLTVDLIRGVALAEGFRQYRHHPYPSTPLLQQLLGDALLTVPA